MNKSLQYLLVVFVFLLLLFFINQNQQNKYKISSELIFHVNEDEIHRILLEEAGDLINAINLGFIKKNNIKADIQELIKNNKLVRDKRSEVTIYKSVGYALSDLAAARLAFRCLIPN